KILYFDISVANILLTDKGNGILIDWELAKRTDKVVSSNLIGTWRFKSANLLQHAKEMPTLAGDLESFLHVLGWTTLLL
ncbi:hypothetical protein OG21DRAFT_1374018, partial [Imleria badia]